MRVLAIAILWLTFGSFMGWNFHGKARAAPARHGPVTQFAGDRYAPKMAQDAGPRDVTRWVRERRRAHPRAGKRRWVPAPRPRPGYVTPKTAKRAGPSKSLAGVVGPLAAKARELQSLCGSRIISAVRHTYIAGTGGRLSLHASGRAVDIVGNPGCMYAALRHWPGGVSVDYGRVRHIHMSWNPGGSEWGTRFHHYRGKYRKSRSARRRG